MDHDDWAVTACLMFADGALVDKQRPFGTYHIEAKTADEAVKQLKKDFPMCHVTVCGKPVHSIVTEEEYENG